MGDADGDGLDDFVVGAPDALGSGAVYLVTGAPSGTSTLSTYPTLTGPAARDDAGAVVAGADLDGDGLGDLVVGAPGYDAGGSDRGAVFFVRSPVTGGIDLLSAADAVFEGEVDDDGAPSDLGCPGDVDGDGLDDVLIGVDDSAGAAYVLAGTATGTATLGSAPTKVLGAQSTDRLGEFVSAGDVDGDGFLDLAVTGRSLWLFRGPLAGTLDVADADGVWVGDADAVDAGADIDGDGFADVLVGSPSHEEEEGAAHLLFGGLF